MFNVEARVRSRRSTLNWGWTLTFNIKLELGLYVDVKLETVLTFNMKLELGLDV